MHVKTCCFTGHRWARLEKAANISQDELRWRTADAVRAAYADGYRSFVTGLAQGFDLIAAEIVIAMKRRELTDIKVIGIAPYLSHEHAWSGFWRERCRWVCDNLDDRCVMHPSYFRGCELERDRAMVDASTLVIAAYDGGSSGGTAYTVRYAEKKGIKIVNLLD